MSESRRVGSISRQIARYQLWRMLWTFLFINLLITVVAVLGFCYTAEKGALGDSWTIKLQRGLTFADAPTALARMRGAIYTFSLPEGAAHTIAIGTFFNSLYKLFQTLFVFQLIWMWAEYQSGKRKAKRLMQPLTEMAAQAQILAASQFDQDKVHTLQDAIDRFSPQTPEDKLRTGDKDLSGLESAINQLLSRMHDSFRQQARFVSDASHELRTPISVIKGYTEMLSRWGKDDPKVLGEGLTAIKAEADNMQRLVEQLLFLARSDAGRTPIDRSPVDLAALMKDIKDEYDMINAGHRWRLKADVPVWTTGDSALIKQAVRVLCDNAAKYAPDGTPITLSAFTDDKGVACLAVQDNGQGIAPEALPHIFERFYRADPARTRGGTGLGLSIAGWVAESHGGYITVFSRPGMGTRMTLCLPGEDEKAGQTEEA